MFDATRCRMGRAALGWSVQQLAERADVAVNTVVRFERGRGSLGKTAEALQAALERGGVRFRSDGCVCPPGSGSV